MKKNILLLLCILFFGFAKSQPIKILFDASKAETAGNADWVIDSDLFNLGFSTGPAIVGGGNESNPQKTPTPAQSTIISSTTETYWTGALSAWGIDCVKKGYQVETLPYNGVISYGNSSNTQDLSNYKIFVVDEPNIVFTTTEKTAIIQFVQNGGSLFMVSDHTVSDRNNDGWDSPAIWNDLFTNNSIQNNPFGISFDLVNISGSSTNITTNTNDSLIHGSFGNVSQVLWSNGTTMTINTTANSSVKVAVYKSGASNTGTTNVMVAYARYGLGKVVAFGDSSPFDDGTGDPNDALYNGYYVDASGDHQRIIMNATIWLATTTVLPVNLLSFDCSLENNSVSVKWQTANEINTSYFEIEKSKDLKEFKANNKTYANGKNNLVQNYSFTDFLNAQDVLNNKLFYRLKIIDADGRFSYSNVKAVSLINKNVLFSTIYPNPNKGDFFIDDKNMNRIVISDYLGRMIFSKNIQANEMIHLSSLQKGIYFVRLFQQNQFIKTEKNVVY